MIGGEFRAFLMSLMVPNGAARGSASEETVRWKNLSHEMSVPSRVPFINFLFFVPLEASSQSSWIRTLQVLLLGGSSIQK